MHHRVASTCLHCVPGLKYSRVFNDLSKRLFQRAFQRALNHDAELSNAAHKEQERSSPKTYGSNQEKTSLRGIGLSENIIIGDLAATLEAHRASNRASIIRKIGRPPPEYQSVKVKRPLQDEQEDHGSSKKRVANGSGPTTSIQKAVSRETEHVNQAGKVATGSVRLAQRPRRRSGGTRGRIARKARKASLASEALLNKKMVDTPQGLDYPGKYQSPKEEWYSNKAVERSGVVNKSPRPWLAYIDNSDHVQRLDRLVLHAYPSPSFTPDPQADYPPRSKHLKHICA